MTSNSTATDVRDLVHEAARIAQEGGTDTEREEFASRKAALLAEGHDVRGGESADRPGGRGLASE